MSGTITQTADQVKVGSNTSIIGKDKNAKLVNFGMLVRLLSISTSGSYADPILSLIKKKTNVIIRNLGVSKVLADNGDAIGIREFPPCSPIS